MPRGIGQQRCEQLCRLTLHLRRELLKAGSGEAHTGITRYTFIHSLQSARLPRAASGSTPALALAAERALRHRADWASESVKRAKLIACG